MKLLSTISLILSFTLLPCIAASQVVSSQEKKPPTPTLTCPNSGKGTPTLQFTLTALGGFELPKDQTMFLPIQFDHAKMENGDPEKRVKLSCVYNTFTEKGTPQKTITLVAYTAPNAKNCKMVSSMKDEKLILNQLVCKDSK